MGGSQKQYKLSYLWYYSGFDHPQFFKPSLCLTVIWLAGFIGCLISNKDFIVKRLPFEDAA